LNMTYPRIATQSPDDSPEGVNATSHDLIAE